ncbi:MAG: DEAD/DEAH box helicase, partial [Bacteroidales bacterium]|nr:DEAD/DEAH box helicase [Bacteroidales bacterium]
MKHEVLRKYFGYAAFRKGQEEVIDSVLQKRDCLAVMPTGAGKSICFQVPAMIFDGITIVISPLISLMRDQVSGLVEDGIPAAFINTELTFAQMLKVLENAKNGEYKIIYVAPERLDTALFADFAANAGISMIAIDEAHC